MLLIVCAGPVPAVSGNRTIEGAFGIHFSDPIDVTGLEKLRADKNGGLRYRFKPAKPYGPLSDYSVFVTPSTLRVYQVTAIGHYGSMVDCKTELARLEKILSDKYPQTMSKIKGRFGDIPKIAYGVAGRVIEATCEGVFNRRELIVTYMDESLKDEAAREAERLASQQDADEIIESEDTSGL